MLQVRNNVDNITHKFNRVETLLNVSDGRMEIMLLSRYKVTIEGSLMCVVKATGTYFMLKLLPRFL